MASRKRQTAKSRGGKKRATIRKKTVKRTVAKRTKKTVKKRTTKARRSGGWKRIEARQPTQTPVVRETVVDVVDEPLPGVVRVTEIEEMEVTVPETDEDE